MSQPFEPVTPPEPTRHRRRMWPWVVGAAVVLIIGMANRGTDRQQAESPAAASSATPAAATATTTTPPPTTVEPTTPPPPPEEPKVHQGRGDSVIKLDRRRAIGVVAFECPKCTGNTVVKSDGAESLLVNEIGAYSGKRWIDIRENSRTTTLTVQARGAWKLTVGGIGLGRVVPAGEAVSGRGDDVLLVGGTSEVAKVTNTGEGNFAVHHASMITARLELLINEIGGYEGTVPFTGSALVQVTSSGKWTIAPS